MDIERGWRITVLIKYSSWKHTMAKIRLPMCRREIYRFMMRRRNDSNKKKKAMKKAGDFMFSLACWRDSLPYTWYRNDEWNEYAFSTYCSVISAFFDIISIMSCCSAIYRVVESGGVHTCWESWTVISEISMICLSSCLQRWKWEENWILNCFDFSSQLILIITTWKDVYLNLTAFSKQSTGLLLTQRIQKLVFLITLGNLQHITKKEKKNTGINGKGLVEALFLEELRCLKKAVHHVLSSHLLDSVLRLSFSGWHQFLECLQNANTLIIHDNNTS